MKTTEDLLSELRRRDVSVRAEGGDLAVRAPKGTLTAELREELARKKQELLEALRNAPARPQGIPALPLQETYEVSHAQRRLWILSQLEEASSAYNVPLSVFLDGDLDSAALRRAFYRLVMRHESLRTAIVSVDGEPQQKIATDLGWELGIRDLSRAADPDAEAREAAREFTAAPFDLGRAPLFRAELLRLAPQRHALLFVLHHIISDGWSLSVLMRDLSALYNGTVLPPLRIQYRDFAAWQNEQLRGGAAVAHQEYWTARLAPPLPVLDLPSDRPRPAVQTFRGDMFCFEIGARERDALHALGRSRNATLFMVLAALVKLLLHRYTGERDIILGTPVAGRTDADLEDQIGFYLNTLVLRDTVRPEMPFAELLEQVRDTCLGAYEHQLYPFDKLVDELGLRRDLSRAPLFDVLIVLQNAGRLELRLDGISASELFVEPGTSKYDLSFDFVDQPGSLLVGIRYNTGLFHRDRVERMAGHFAELARSVLADPQYAVGRANLLMTGERELLLRDVNRTEEPAAHQTVVDLFEEQVRKSPDAIAVSGEDGQLTYQELSDRTGRVARRLVSQGVAPGERVALMLDRSPEMVVALLGILKAGCAYVPLDAAFPQQRLAAMLRDSAPAVRMGTDGTFPIETGSSDADAVLPSPGSDDCAYVLYTSGSTGTPKGVEVSHGALANLLLAMKAEPGLAATDALLAVTTISFDIAGLELFLPLICGARVVIASSAVASDAALLAQRLARGDITVMQATPSTWRMLLAVDWKGAPNLAILCGGEALPRDLALKLLPRCKALWNMYGPTETTIWSTVHRVTAEDRETTVRIGHPIRNTRVYILDTFSQPLPVGVPGELYIGGAGVARGYRNEPELTAQRFVPDPFSRESGQRLYRTGDRAQFLPNGNIEFLGRLDHQVKVRGFRIETGEVEKLLLQHPHIREAVVVSDTDDAGEVTLVACLVPHGEAAAPAGLRRYLAESLPAYMIPSAFVWLDALPLTANGKVDRRALSAARQAGFPRAASDAEPRNQMERDIARVFAEILGVERVGIHDSFFELGGHSIKATRAVFRLQTHYCLGVRLIDLFQNPTVAQLAEFAVQNPRAPEPELARAAIAPMTAEELEMLRDDQ